MTLSRGVGRPRAVLAKAEKAKTQAARKAAGPLRELRVAPSTALRYKRAMSVFFRWLDSETLNLPSKVEDLDQLASQYIEYCWQNGDGRAMAADLCSGLQWTSPSTRGHLPGSWALLNAWRKNELPMRAPPMPPKVLFALSEWGITQGLPGFALGLVLAFHCLLRTSEMVSLTFGQISWADDFRSAVIDLGWTKGGKRRGAAESVTVDIPWLAVALQALRSKGTPIDTVVGLSMAKFRKLFREGCFALGCADWGFSPYSLRRGGATELWRQTGSLSRATLRGRWGQASTARIYVNDGLATLAGFRLPRQPHESLAAAWAKRMHATSCLFPG